MSRRHSLPSGPKGPLAFLLVLPLILIFGGGSALAQTSNPEPATASYLPSTPSVTGGAAGAWLNPASWATTDGFEAAFGWNDRNLRPGSLDNWGLSLGDRLGFSAQTAVYPLADTTARLNQYQLGFAWGDRRIHGGFAWRWPGGDTEAFDVHSGLMLGAIARPGPGVSFGVSGFLRNAYNPDEGMIDLGIRPFGRPFLTLFGDYSVVQSQKLSDGSWGAGAEIRPYRGLMAGVRFQDADGPKDFDYRIYAGVSLEALAFDVLPGYNGDGDHQDTGYLARINPPYRGLPLGKALRDRKKDRVVPLSLEGRTLVYQKARWGDEDRVAWLPLSRHLDAIAADPGVEGVALDLSGFRASPALQWELREKLQGLKQAGKHVYIHGDRFTMGSFFLASVADRLSLDPQGFVLIPGFAAYRTYMRSFFDKVGVGVEEWQYFTYKTAFQRYARTGMSEADSIQLGRLTDVIYDTWRNGIAEGRGLSPAAVDSLVNDEVLLHAADAKAAGLVDVLDRWPAFTDSLRKEKTLRLGPLPHERGEPIPLPDDRWGRLPEIHIVYAIGPCEMDSGIRGRATSRELRRLASDRDVKAVVLRADSPGGDPLPSDLVAAGLQQLRRKGKPALVSQGNVAASGGYWISMDGTRILTTPVTVTGSIGVIAGWFWDNGLGEKTGFHAEGVQRGTSADLFTGLRFPLLGITIPTRNLTPTEQEGAKQMILETYDTFVDKVAKARSLSVEHVRDVAQGRVWMGGDAISRGLCDGFGGLDSAVDEARRMAGLETEPVLLVEYPEPPLFRTPKFLPNVPGLGFLSGLLFGTREIPAPPPSLLGEDYEGVYLKAIAESPAQPLVLTPPELVPKGWIEAED